MTVGNPKDNKRNHEGYIDLTPHKAMRNVYNDEETRFRKLLGTIFYICELAGFRIHGRIELEDTRTGRRWK